MTARADGLCGVQETVLVTDRTQNWDRRQLNLIFITEYLDKPVPC